MKEFEYFCPETVQEALSLANKYKDAKYIAGGTDVLVKMKHETNSPSILISVKRLKELSYVKTDKKTVSIGAITTIRELEKSDLINKGFICLYDALRQIGSVQIRNVATIGGNLCSSLPSADTAAPLLVLGAQVKITSCLTASIMPLSQFFVGPGRNSLKDQELLTEILIPRLPAGATTAYIKFGRRNAMEIALAGAAVFLQTEPKGKLCQNVRIALTTSAPTPVRATNAEAFLVGKELTPENIAATGMEALKDASPRDSYRSTAEYRRSIIPVLVKRAIQTTLQRGALLND